jgi:hypothetical protein
MPAPNPPADVAGGSPATSAWANAVADAVQQLIADLYPAGVLGMTWANVSGKPTAFPPIVHAHTADPLTGGPVGYGDIAGKPSKFAPTVHDHSSAAAGGGIPYDSLVDIPALGAYALGGWLRGTNAHNGTFIWVQPGAPSGPDEGDLWVKG